MPENKTLIQLADYWMGQKNPDLPSLKNILFLLKNWRGDFEKDFQIFLDNKPEVQYPYESSYETDYTEFIVFRNKKIQEIEEFIQNYEIH